MNEEEIQEAAKKAAELAQVVPEALRGEAFKKIYDTLIATTLGSSSHGVLDERASRSVKGGGLQRTVHGSSIEGWMNGINRTRYPEILQGRTALELALRVLLLAREDFSNEWLTPGEVSRILKDKFRVTVSTPAVRMAISDKSALVDRQQRPDRTYQYRIMQGGEDYLAKPREVSGDGVHRLRRRKNGKPKGSAGSSTAPAKGGQRSSSGRSPKALVAEILREGFFDTPRTIGELASHLAHKKARILKSTDLSPLLTRMIRNQELNREKNADGQYAYSRR